MARGRRETELQIPDTDPVPLGTKIRFRRRVFGYSRIEFGILAGDYPGSTGPYSPRTVSNVETGTRNPGDLTLERFCAVLAISPTDMISATREQVLAWQEMKGVFATRVDPYTIAEMPSRQLLEDFIRNLAGVETKRGGIVVFNSRNGRFERR